MCYDELCSIYISYMDKYIVIQSFHGFNLMNNRIDLIDKLEKRRDSRLIIYATGDREGKEVEASIEADVLPVMDQHLNHIGCVPKLDLLIYSRGGDVLTGSTIANSLRKMADEVNVLVPFRAHGCATSLALSTNQIVAGPRAEFGPISRTTPHRPYDDEGTGQFLTRGLHYYNYDYIINRRKAKTMGLPVVEAEEEEAQWMWGIYESLAQEMQLDVPWRLSIEAKAEQPRQPIRAILQSRDMKHIFSSKIMIQISNDGFMDFVDFDILDQGTWKQDPSVMVRENKT